MSELKAFDIVVAEEGYCEGIVKYRRAVYDKSEADKVIAHNKYKRCLAMAMWCLEKWADIATPYGKSVWYNKWQKRWLSLAYKFKPNKSTAQ